MSWRTGPRAAGSLEPAAGGSSEELSLVSTQVLRKVLKTGTKRRAPNKDPGGGFDPYNSG